MAVIFPEATLPFTEEDGIYGFETTSDVRLFALKVGDYCEVIWDGDTYTTQAKSIEIDGGSLFVVGNASILGLGEETSEPFLFIEGLSGTTYSYIIATTLTEETHTIAINSERAINIVLAERVLSFAYNEDYGAYVNNSNPSLFLPVEGETYIIVWDGIEYNSTALTNENFPNQVMLGNPILVGGENTNEPFAMSSLADGSGMSLFSLDTSDTHRLAVYKEVEKENETPDEPTEPEETTGVTITLYDRTGQAVNYDNVETLTTDTPDAEQGAIFTHGVAVENAEYEPNFANGNQKCTLEKGQLLKEFTLIKPENLSPEYIKKNVEVAGVLGEFAGDEMEKTVELAMADGDQVIEADEDTVLTKVIVKKPETLISENIAEGVNVGGIEGKHKDYSKGIIEGTVEEVVNAQVSQIASYAFYGNKMLKQADFQNCKAIGSAAFSACTSLKMISFPNCEKLSDYYTFAGCTALESAVMPVCESLGLGSAFARCVSMSYVEMPKCSSVPSGTFSGCSKLANISFPECKHIGSQAFTGCSSLESVIMENCEQIDTYAFQSCYKLNSCSFPNLKELNSAAFSGCTKLSQSESYVYYVGDMAVSAASMFSSSTCTFRAGTRLIAQGICSNKSKMTSVAGMEDVEVIGKYAFLGCLSAYFGGFSKVKYIGLAAFSSCSRLNYVDAPECERIGGTYAFARCVSLYTVSMPKIESLPDATFMFCSNMYSASFENAKVIGSSAFQGCWSLQKMFLPKGQSIFNYAFSGCSSLSAVIIGDFQKLASYAFASCYRLISLYLLGSSVGGSGGYMLNSTPINGYSTYAGKYGSIFVRESLLNAFKTSWKTWSSRFVGMTDDEIAALYAEWGYTE